MTAEFIAKTTLTYPTDPEVDDALRQFGAESTRLAQIAVETRDPRDIDAAATAESARQDALRLAFASGAMKTVSEGDLVTDLPARSIPWLLEQGHVVKRSVPAPPVPTTPVRTPAGAK